MLFPSPTSCLWLQISFLLCFFKVHASGGKEILALLSRIPDSPEIESAASQELPLLSRWIATLLQVISSHLDDSKDGRLPSLLYTFGACTTTPPTSAIAVSLCLEKSIGEEVTTVACVRWMNTQTCIYPDGRSSDCYSPTNGLAHATINATAGTNLHGDAGALGYQRQTCLNYDQRGTLRSVSVCVEFSLGYGEGYETERLVESDNSSEKD